jgi:hypothetical protein
MTTSTDGGPMVAIRRFVEGFNSNDGNLILMACADETTIIDDFPPHQWSGRGATAAWLRDMNKMATTYGMSDPAVILEEPSMAIVSDRNAYLVVPIDVRWLEDGTPAERRGFMAAALRDEADEWRISTLAWTWG